MRLMYVLYGQKLVFIVLFCSQLTLNRNEKIVECRQTTAANRHIDYILGGQRLNLNKIHCTIRKVLFNFCTD